MFEPDISVRVVVENCIHFVVGVQLCVLVLSCNFYRFVVDFYRLIDREKTIIVSSKSVVSVCMFIFINTYNMRQSVVNTLKRV